MIEFIVFKIDYLIIARHSKKQQGCSTTAPYVYRRWSSSRHEQPLARGKVLDPKRGSFFVGGIIKIDLPDVNDLVEGDSSISLHEDGQTVFVIEVSKWDNLSAAKEYIDYIKIEAQGLLSGTLH